MSASGADSRVVCEKKTVAFDEALPELAEYPSRYGKYLIGYEGHESLGRCKTGLLSDKSLTPLFFLIPTIIMMIVVVIIV